MHAFNVIVRGAACTFSYPAIGTTSADVILQAFEQFPEALGVTAMLRSAA